MRSLLFISIISVFTLVGCNETTAYRPLSSLEGSSHNELPTDSGEILDTGSQTGSSTGGATGSSTGGATGSSPSGVTESNTEEPYFVAHNSSSCKNQITMTSGGRDIKFTVIASPVTKLELTDYKEFLALSPSDQDFIKRSVDNEHSNISTVENRLANQINQSETLKIESKDAAAQITSLAAGSNLNYYFVGNRARFSATAIKENSKVLLVMNSKYANLIELNSVKDGAEIFVLFLNESGNATCVNVTGVKGEIATYVVGRSGEEALSVLEATSFKNESVITQSVISDKDGFLKFSATSMSATQVNQSITGLGKVGTYMEMTALGSGVTFNIHQRSQKTTDFTLDATSAGSNTVINLDLKSPEKSEASFSFTDPSNVEISGQISSANSKLNLNEKIKKSKTVKIDVKY